MTSPTLLFYVSGHGYGHARRSAQVIRALQSLRPDVEVQVRTATDPSIFHPLPAERIHRSNIDVGMVERDTLTIDRERSLERLLTFMDRREATLAAEVAAARTIAPALIATDIPFLAADVAHATGVPCVGISNFTWDWIYAHLFGDDPRYAPIAPLLTGANARMTALLQLPFGGTCPAIRRTIPMPLVAMRSDREPAEVLALLGITPDDSRPRVLFGTRGGLAGQTLAAAARDAGEFLFLCPGAAREGLPTNTIPVTLGPTLDFSDVLRVSDIVVSKLGYGMISECIATQTRLVWPRREGFAEDAVVAAEAPRHVPMREIARDDFRAGRWGAALREAMVLEPRVDAMRTDGAAECAKYIGAMLIR